MLNNVDPDQTAPYKKTKLVTVNKKQKEFGVR